jgi:phage shock protein A
MGLFDHVSHLMTSDIDHLLDRAEDPERVIQQVIGDMEESIVGLRREMVAAVTRQNRLRAQLFTAEEAASRIEREATLALARGEELRARQVVSREIGTLKSRDTFALALADASRLSARLVAHLIRMEDRAQVARRKRDELMRRRRGAEMEGLSRLTRVPAVRAFDGYAQAVTALEVEAEATRERPASGRASPAGSEIRFGKAERELEGGGQC